MSLCDLSSLDFGIRIKIADPKRSQNPRRPRRALSHRPLLLAMAQIDFHHPHGFQNLPGFLRRQVQTR